MDFNLSSALKSTTSRLPGRTAVVCGIDKLTYVELNSKVDKLASTLYDLGIRKGQRIGILLPRCLETMIAIYGVLRVGAVYVPMDPKTPLQRLQFVVEDCGIENIVTIDTLSHVITQLSERMVDLKFIGTSEGVISWQEMFSQETEFISNVNILEDDLAYILYTSGSTGRPKGIMHTHRSGMAYAMLTAKLYKITTDDVIGNHAPIHFDISTLGYLTGPYVGATTVIIGDGELIFPKSLIDCIKNNNISIWYSVPLVLIQLVQSEVYLNVELPALRYFLYAGEPCPPKYLRLWHAQFPEIEFSNIYGPTELNQCTYFNFYEIPEDWEDIPLGTTWENTEFRLLDDENQPVGHNTLAELAVRSATMMLGYWNKPELTASRLYKEYSDGGVEKCFYKTGDLVILDKNGVLHFKGRKDHQVKVRGYRIELGDIEAKMNSNEDIAESICFVNEENEEKQIVCAYLLKKAGSLSTNEILRYLKSELPAYAVPSRLYESPDFPRNRNGKIDRIEIKKIYKEKWK